MTTDEQYLLASAYLDGELTDDERRLAEADPAVMAEVEQLRALQAEIADVEPPTAAAQRVGDRGRDGRVPPVPRNGDPDGAP